MNVNCNVRVFIADLYYNSMELYHRSRKTQRLWEMHNITSYHRIH